MIPTFKYIKLTTTLGLGLILRTNDIIQVRDNREYREIMTNNGNETSTFSVTDDIDFIYSFLTMNDKNNESVEIKPLNS